jgi:hypothetical protein
MFQICSAISHLHKMGNYSYINDSSISFMLKFYSKLRKLGIAHRGLNNNILHMITYLFV